MNCLLSTLFPAARPDRRDGRGWTLLHPRPSRTRGVPPAQKVRKLREAQCPGDEILR